MLNEISWLSVRSKVKQYPRVRDFSFSYLLIFPVFPSGLISTERNKTAYIWCRKNHGTHNMPTALAMPYPTDSQPPTEGREFHNRKECRLLGIIITTASASCVRSLSHFVLFLHPGHTHFCLFKLLIFTRTFFLKCEWIYVIYLCYLFMCCITNMGMGLYVYWPSMHIEIRGQLVRLSSFLFPCWFWVSISNHHMQTPLITETCQISQLL